MNRLLFIIGSALFVASAMGFLFWGRLIVDTFELMSYQVIEPPDPLPSSLGRLGLIAVSAFGLSSATVLCCFGLSLSKSKQSISSAGRVFIAISALAIMGSAVMGARACWWAFSTFGRVAQVGGIPLAEEFDPVIGQGGAMLSSAGGALVLAAIFLVLASVFGFQKLPTRDSTSGAKLRWLLLALPQVLICLLFAFLFLLVSFHGVAILDLIANANSTPDPSKLASHLNGIYLKSLMGFVLLFGTGLLWAVEAFVAPQGYPNAKGS